MDCTHTIDFYILWDTLCRQTSCLLVHNMYIVCAVIFPAVIISPPYISSHCSDRDNPNDDLPISMLHVILNESYHKKNLSLLECCHHRWFVAISKSDHHGRCCQQYLCQNLPGLTQRCIPGFGSILLVQPEWQTVFHPNGLCHLHCGLRKTPWFGWQFACPFPTLRYHQSLGCLQWSVYRVQLSLPSFERCRLWSIESGCVLETCFLHIQLLISAWTETHLPSKHPGCNWWCNWSW